MSPTHKKIRDGWSLRRNPAWNKRIRAWLRELIAEKSYADPSRCFRCYAPKKATP